jgi:hypothetical protein
MYVHVVDDVRQTEIHTSVPLVPEPSSFEAEIAIDDECFYFKSFFYSKQFIIQ